MVREEEEVFGRGKRDWGALRGAGKEGEWL
jgi:hypothetical protein